jgi:hypothetical protein
MDDYTLWGSQVLTQLWGETADVTTDPEGLPKGHSCEGLPTGKRTNGKFQIYINS